MSDQSHFTITLQSNKAAPAHTHRTRHSATRPRSSHLSSRSEMRDASAMHEAGSSSWAASPSPIRPSLAPRRRSSIYLSIYPLLSASPPQPLLPLTSALLTEGVGGRAARGELPGLLRQPAALRAQRWEISGGRSRQQWWSISGSSSSSSSSDRSTCVGAYGVSAQVEASLHAPSLARYTLPRGRLPPEAPIR